MTGVRGASSMSMSDESKNGRELVRTVRFGLFSPDEVKRLSVCSVKETGVFTQQLPTVNGPCDHRMGVGDRRLLCGTCGRGLLTCPGHLGSISLAYPVYHVGFLDIVLKLLRCCCFFCSALLIPPSETAALSKIKDRKARLTYAVAQTKNKRTCWRVPACGGCNPSYTKQSQSIRCDFTKCTFADEDEMRYCQRPFTAQEARLILQSISASDLALLGFGPDAPRPENFILTELPVIPPVVRPSVVVGDNSRARGLDDLTLKICDIVKANHAVRTALEAESSAIPEVGISLSAQQAVADLAWNVSTFMNNDIRGQRPSTHRNGLLTRSIRSRLVGKDGRIRGFLMGKRVDFSARSVVSPDSHMDVDEVGIPRHVASKLTIPERVTEHNIDVLRERISAGPGVLEGAHAVLRDGKLLLLEVADRHRLSKTLRVGDVVERFLQEGDKVLFNRQPSLHRASIMCYNVVIMEGDTFRLNLAATVAVNGDFDGDELNIHVPQDVEARAEAWLVMGLPRHIVSPQSNKPIIGLVQDCVIGAWLLTDPETRIDATQMCELRCCLKYATREMEAPFFPPRTFSGLQAVNMLLPRDLDYSYEATGVRVRAGRLLSGRLCKKTVGVSSGGLVHHLWLHFGADIATRFLSDAQRLINRWLCWRGFSIRLSDCEASLSLRAQVATVVELAEEKAVAVTDFASRGLVDREGCEEALASLANGVLTSVGKFVHASLQLSSNALYQAVTCGSKGNLINMTQLLGIVGQQSVEGKRICVDPGGHPLGAESGLGRHGFVRNSYTTGLTAYEFFHHTMAGREGLIDTAVKTANTGYLQRRLMKAMDPLVTGFDGSVRNLRGSVVQPLYGADGDDASCLIRQSLEFLRRPWSELESELEPSEMGAFFEARRRTVARWRGSPDARESSWSCLVPCLVAGAIERALLERERKADTRPGEAGDDAADDVGAGVEGLIADVCRPLGCVGARRWMLECLVRWHFRHRVVSKLAPAVVLRALRELRRQAARARVAPGEAVGAVAAQSISEPLTQLTLNTFHMAGVKEKNVTLGVPRVRELIDCTKAMRRPKMRLPLLPSFSREDVVRRVEASVMCITLGQVVISLTIEECPQFWEAHGPAREVDRLILERERMLSDGGPQNFCPYVARMVLDPSPLLRRGLTPPLVADMVEKRLADVHICCSERQHSEWILRVRPAAVALDGLQCAPGSVEERVFLRDSTEALAHRLCRDVMLSGITGVASATAHRGTLASVDARGDFTAHPITFLDTVGSNLRAALTLPDLFVAAHCTSNDVHDVLVTLGVEAAARVLFEELRHVLSFDGMYIDDRHLLLLVNTMTRDGGLLPISRHGINRSSDTGALTRASFEEIGEVFMVSAAYGDVDPVRDVAPHIMLGQRLRIGTGVVEVVDTGFGVPGDAERSVKDMVASKKPIDEESEEEVVFTSVEGEVEAMTTMFPPAPELERPYLEAREKDSVVPFASGGMRLEAPFTVSRPQIYTPTSPKHLLRDVLNFKPDAAPPTTTTSGRSDRKRKLTPT